MKVHLETLSDYLCYHKITKEDACKLFGRTDRTLARWENEPPEWAIRIIKLLGHSNKQLFIDEWENWYFDKDYLVDDSGNKYNIAEIRAIFYTRQLTDTLTGDQMVVRSLKQRLEKQLKHQPVLKISLVEGDTKEELKAWSIAL